MKKLVQLKPDLRTTYLNEGKGEEVNYLHISNDLTLKALENDVKAGAVQFQECLDLAQKKPSKFVIINCKNKEEGLMAASYLAGVYNEIDGVLDEDYDYDEFIGGSLKRELQFDDSISIEEEFDFSEDCEDEEYGATTYWEESPYNIPLVDYDEINRWESSADVFNQGPFSMNGDRNMGMSKPYWMAANRESICILFQRGGWSFLSLTGAAKKFRRFKRNKHVFLINVLSVNVDTFNEFDGNESDIDELCEITLEYCADLIQVPKLEDEEKENYYVNLFDNWTKKFFKKLEKNFPKKTIVKQIVSMNNPDKSQLMEKVFQYVLKGEVGNVLKKKDFDVLQKFAKIGTTEEKKVTSTEKLKTSLVGMEYVKEQINGIVNVVKYNKRRMEMGFGESNFHNVHLLIGAPGTAKTTVAQLLGNIMCEEHLLPGNRFRAINGADLKGLYVGHSAPKTRQLFEENDIILIDEAYSIASDNEPDSFSQEAIAQLIIELEKHGMDKLVMFAGYGGTGVESQDNKMKKFIDANPGIKSRINSTIYFDSYTPEQMVDIVRCQAKNMKFEIPSEADAMILEYFKGRVRDRNFGNGREARSFVENAMIHAANRLSKMDEKKVTKAMYKELAIEDIQKTIEKLKADYRMQAGQKRRQLGFCG